MAMKERRSFSDEFKREAVKLDNQAGSNKAEITRDLGIGANLLGRWCRNAAKAGGLSTSAHPDQVSVQTEMSLQVLAYNMKRMINILGTETLIAAMRR